jgi:hypothetical protein
MELTVMDFPSDVAQTATDAAAVAAEQ